MQHVCRYEEESQYLRRISRKFRNFCGTFSTCIQASEVWGSQIMKPYSTSQQRVYNKVLSKRKKNIVLSKLNLTTTEGKIDRVKYGPIDRNSYFDSFIFDIGHTIIWIFLMYYYHSWNRYYLPTYTCNLLEYILIHWK